MRNTFWLNEASAEKARSAIVIADNYESPFSIGDLAQTTLFLDELPENLEISETELYLLNLPLQRGYSLSRSWIAAGHLVVNYWVTYENWERLEGITQLTEELFLREVTYDRDWIKLVLVGSSANTLDKESFYRGLSALKFAKGAGRLEFAESTLTEPSFRSLLVDKLVPLAKPMKRYIPNKMVIALYKILERIR